jgi:hypothetical protein
MLRIQEHGFTKGVKMNMKILISMLVLLIAVPVAFAGWIDDNGEPSWLVFGEVFLENGTAANNATYTIRTYNHDAGGEMLSSQSGIVGEVVENHIYNSRNLIDSAGDTVIVEVVYDNQSKTVVHTVTATEAQLHVIHLNDLKLKTGTDDEEEKVKTIGMDVTRILLTRGEYLSVGELLGTGIRVENNYDTDLEDVRVTVGVPDLGLVKRAGPFDLDDGDEVLKDLYIEIPEWAEPGEYYIRIDISNDEVKRVVHRVFTVI